MNARTAPITNQFLSELGDALHAEAGLSFDRDTLAKLVLENPQLQSVKPGTLASRAKTLRTVYRVSKGSFHKLILSSPYVLRRSPSAIAANHVALARYLGISSKALADKTVNHRRLATISLKRARQISEHLTTGLALDEQTVIGLLVKAPTLLGRNPETIVTNALSAMRALGCSSQDYMQLVWKSPGILARTPDALIMKVNAIARVLDVDTYIAAKLMMRSPSLFLTAPETVEHKLHSVSEALGIPLSQWKGLCLRKPPLLNYRAATIEQLIGNIAQLFEMTAADVAAILVRYPSLIGIRAQTMLWKVPLVTAISRTLGYPDTKADTFRNHPLAYTYSLERLRQRLLLAEAGLGPRSVDNLLSLAHPKALIHLQAIERLPSST